MIQSTANPNNSNNFKDGCFQEFCLWIVLRRWQKASTPSTLAFTARRLQHLVRLSTQTNRKHLQMTKRAEVSFEGEILFECPHRQLEVLSSLAAPASAAPSWGRLPSPLLCSADQRTFSDRDRCAAGKACSVNGSALLVIFRFNWQLGPSYI